MVCYKSLYKDSMFCKIFDIGWFTVTEDIVDMGIIKIKKGEIQKYLFINIW